MHPLTAPVLAAAGLLLLAGGSKLLRPAGTAQALRTQGLPSSAATVRLLGVGEIAVAAAALLRLPAGIALLAAAYAGFTAFVVLALVRSRPLSSCGCFAEPDLPPTWAHVGVTAGLAGVAATAAARGAPVGVPDLMDEGWWAAAGTTAGALLVGWLAYLVLAELPRLRELSKPVEKPAEGPQLFAIVPVRSSAS